MIQVEQLTKCYGDHVAVDGISFEVERGQIVGFLGPNGAGKTTTMRMLTSYLPASAGQARVAGHDVFTESLAARRNIGYLPEGVPLYPEMRVEEFLSFRARIKQVPPKERSKRIQHVMDRCSLTDVRRQLIGSLSKGFRQRVGLAEALVHDPPVLILDEPTIGLDPNQIRQVRELIRELGQEHTILLSTHILTEVEMICQDVLIIANGKAVYREKLSRIGGGGGSRVVVEARAPGANALPQFQQIEGVLDVSWDGAEPVGRFTLSVAPNADVSEQVYQCAVRNNWTLRELRREQPSLEEIFVRLTAKEVK